MTPEAAVPAITAPPPRIRRLIKPKSENATDGEGLQVTGKRKRAEKAFNGVGNIPKGAVNKMGEPGTISGAEESLELPKAKKARILKAGGEEKSIKRDVTPMEMLHGVSEP